MIQRPSRVFAAEEPAVSNIKEGATGQKHNQDNAGGFLWHSGGCEL